MAACVCFQRPYAEVNSPKLFTWIDVNALLVLLLERLMLDLHANTFRVAFKDLLFSCLRSSKVTEDFHLSFSACLLLTRPLVFFFPCSSPGTSEPNHRPRLWLKCQAQRNITCQPLSLFNAGQRSSFTAVSFKLNRILNMNKKFFFIRHLYTSGSSMTKKMKSCWDDGFTHLCD